MGNNKHQMKWNKETEIRRIHRLGLDPNVWGALVVHHFGNCDLAETDAQMAKFHDAWRRETR